jgi:hypothetical protein
MIGRTAGYCLLARPRIGDLQGGDCVETWSQNMLKIIKSIFGSASSDANGANAPFSPERRAAGSQGAAHVPERRVAAVPQWSIEGGALPIVDEGNTDDDWNRWQDSVMMQDGQDPTAETAVKPPLPYERRKEPRRTDGASNAARPRN